MVTGSNHTYSEHFVMYLSNHCCTPDTHIILYVSYTSKNTDSWALLSGLLGLRPCPGVCIRQTPRVIPIHKSVLETTIQCTFKKQNVIFLNPLITSTRIGKRFYMSYESDQSSRLELFWFFCRLGSLWKQLSIGGR